MADAPDKLTPPYLPYKTLANTLAGWSVGIPGRIDRSLFRSFSGAMQSWLISTLKYFHLIDGAGSPTSRLERLVASEGPERQKVFAEMVKQGYQFVFANNLDLSKATAGQIQDRFKDTGLQGDTIRKATALFMALAKEAGMPLSPYLKLPRQRRGNGVAKTVPRRKADESPVPPVTPSSPVDQPSKTPVQMLIDMLNIEGMDDAEQQAVWTLIRYLKKGVT